MKKIFAESPDKNDLILIVEDSEEDYFTILRAFKKAGLRNSFVRCKDGDEALDYLFCRREFIDPGKAPRPSIVLLDLNMPGTDGREVLKEIKNTPRLRKIPVVVMTTSSCPDDINRSYDQGANSYISKPIGFEAYIKAVEKIADYWFDIVSLPQCRTARTK
ncbi:FOG: CheY-like receiver [Desulfamplus magnetovallimortis]|uniref:FOG: CheY-like receiver n=1 Tax=Desulfamplus magnetovallimortis TaxID=1246637 RepID=A0A1W1HJC2_9BACT|nr:response regulator [Desulfamplus magnetovallimortis]SLM32458.1 FOG: CheY-like receiver [Desulfamplus magnetovallimortis]